MLSNGVLSDTTLPQELLLDAIHHSETGHLKGKARSNAVSKKDAHGPYQFLRKNLHQMGYKMPTNITLDQVRDTDQARALADKYVTNYSSHHKFETPMQKIAAYNMGPTAAAEWIAAGSNFADLPDETKEYVTRASKFLEKNSMARRINSDSNTSITAGLDKTQEAKEARREELTKEVREQYPKISLPMLESIVKPILAKEFSQPEVAEQRKGQTGVLSDPVPMPAPRPDPALVAATNQMAAPPVDANDTTPQAMLTTPAQQTMPATASPMSTTPLAPPQQAAANNNTTYLGRNTQIPALGDPYDELDPQPFTPLPTNVNSGQGSPIPPPQYNVPALTDPYAEPDMDAIFTEPALGDPYDEKGLGDAFKKPILDSSVITEAQSAALQAASEKRRNATGLSTAPTVNPAGINGSDLIRIGGAMMGGSRQGGLNAIDRATSTYGSLIDAKNSAALEKYKADLEAAGDADDGTAKLKNNAAQISAGIVTGLIDEVIPVIDDDANGLFNSIFGLGGNTTGMFGSLLSKVGGTDANNLRSQLATIKSNIGFDKLQSMREASPTGGALGNVSEKENEYLQSVLGNVEQSQSPEQLKKNLMRLREAYLDIVHGIGNRPTNTTNYSTRSSGSSSGNTITLPNGVVVQRVP